MAKRYFLPNSELYRRYFTKSNKNLMKLDENNIIEIRNDEDLKDLIKGIQDYDFVGDKEIKEFFDSNFPKVRIENIPINLEELKRAFRFMFSELPDELFEEKDTIKLLKRVLNFVFRKKEAHFVISHIINGKLEYKDTYKHKSTIEFYFKMIKLSYDLETYYNTICDSQKVIQRAILKEVLFNNKKIDKKDLEIINRGLNITGNFLLEFNFKLEEFLKEIREHESFIKRTGIFPIIEYNTEKIEVIKRIKQTIYDVEIRIDKVTEAKKIIKDKIGEHKGIISSENAKYLLEIVLEILFG